MNHIQVPSKPLFRDPIFDGAADPTVIWNHQEQSWWMVYTNRRANIDCPGMSWVHGTDIGIASSLDNGLTWTYRGTLQGLEFENGRNTFWAPEIVWHDGVYHMFISYIRGVPHNWIGNRNIVHYTSDDLWNWTFESKVPLSSDKVIDACVIQLPNDKWRMWYKDEDNHSHTFAVDSDNLYDWKNPRPVITDCPHEGPNVFFWHGQYWMITDTWKGLAVYTSNDAERWVRQNRDILNEPGTGADDATVGLHADVLVQDSDAFIFYFTHPERDETYRNQHFADSDILPYKYRRTSIQVAKLELNSDTLVCDRNRPFQLQLNPLYVQQV